MLKPGLGKGLGELMHGDQVAGKGAIPETPPRPNSAFGRGMETLIRPDATPAVTASDPDHAPVPQRTLLPAWFYFAADLLLLAYTVAITLDAARPFDFGTVLFCAVSVTVGALLATVGVYQSFRAR